MWSCYFSERSAAKDHDEPFYPHKNSDTVDGVTSSYKALQVKSKKRILLDKNLDVQSLDLDQAKEIYQANTSKKTKK